MVAKPLANSTFYQRPDDGRSNASARCDPEPGGARILVPSGCDQKNERGRIQTNAFSRHPLVVASLAEAVAAPKALAAAIAHLLPVETESCLRPFARRRFKTARPAAVRIRTRNPCVRRLLIRLG
jgi:hypothetical protein